MAKETKKVKTKAKINWGWEVEAPKSNKRKKSSRAKSKTKKLGLKAMLIILLVTIIGGAIGVGACYFVCRDDCFTIIGEEQIERVLVADGKTATSENIYVDEGVKIVSFGRDISDKVEIETDLTVLPDGTYTASEPRTYYIKYKVDDIKYGKIFTVERVRLIDFVESSEDINVD